MVKQIKNLEKKWYKFEDIIPTPGVYMVYGDKIGLRLAEWIDNWIPIHAKGYFNEDYNVLEITHFHQLPTKPQTKKMKP